MVIDVLRASTTIVYALAAGAAEILPCVEAEAARKLAATLPPGQALLGGERLGLPIQGFDLGNSPSEYTVARVRGRSIVFTSTNGTRAMERCRRAARVLLGAFVNLTALVRLARAPGGSGPLHLLCAGTRGQPTEEDLLLAGAIADGLVRREPDGWRLGREGRQVVEDWRALVLRPRSGEPDPRLLAALRDSLGGRNILATGFERDIPDAARIDRFEVVPELEVASFRIRPFRHT